MSTLIALRFSAMGDVAMSLPVVRATLDQHPTLRIIFVTRAKWQDMVPDHPRLVCHPIDPKGRHKGIPGLWRLHRELSSYQPDGIADLHEVLRTKVLRLFFAFRGMKMAVLDKGRDEKRALTRPHNKVLTELRHMTERYADVFGKLGYPVTLPQRELAPPERIHTIGIAPFAAHASKSYPPEYMKSLIRLLLDQSDVHIRLFGGGPIEAPQLAEWADLSSRITSTHELNLAEQLEAIRELDLMISMDSANMHLASLIGVPVLSIWGGTHPAAGFIGYRQSEALIVQREDLPCRPCSVFGTSTCAREDWACMDIAPSEIWLKLAPMLEVKGK